MSKGVFQGSLFSSDFLRESISRLPDWSGLDDAALETLRLDLRGIFDRFPTAQTPNESQTDLAGCALRGILDVVQKDEIVGEDDHLPDGRFGNQALGNLVSPFVVERSYRIVEYQGGTVRRCRQLCQKGGDGYAGLLSLTQHLGNLGVRLGKQADLILRRAVLPSDPHHLDPDVDAD
jgi:hypothetical protein